MNLIDAIKSGKPIRRRYRQFSYTTGSYISGTTHIHPEAWLDPTWFLSTVHLTADDITADDWETKQEPVLITRDQFWNAYRTFLEAWGTTRVARMPYEHPTASELADHLTAAFGL